MDDVGCIYVWYEYDERSVAEGVIAMLVKAAC